MNARVLVIGDVMIDKYISGNVKRISPEAPVPVLLSKSERYVLGGAANVAINIVASGVDASIMTVIGEDSVGAQLIELLEKQAINTEMVVKSSERITTIKTRFIADNGQQLLRLDEEQKSDIAASEEEQLLILLDKHADEFDLILLSDYCKGVLSKSFTPKAIQIAKKHGKDVYIDVKDPNIHKYDGATLLKPNLKEIGDLTGMPTDTTDEIIKAGRSLLESCGCEYILVTRGGDGMILIGRETSNTYPSAKVEVFDVTGAGDTAIAYLASEISTGSELSQAIRVANIAAGIQVTKRGTSVVTRDEVNNYAGKVTFEDGTDKIVPITEAASIRKNNMDKKIVFTNGCFDILHIGHLRYLEESAKLGDLLVLGLNSDASVRRLKGESRPINSESDRAEMLAALPFIDYIVIFDSDTPYELIKEVQPDVLVKGADYKTKENIVGWDIVEKRGGSVELIDFVPGKSTTNIIKKINDK